MRFKVGDQFTMCGTSCNTVESMRRVLDIKPETPDDAVFVVTYFDYSKDGLIPNDKYTLSYCSAGKEVVVSGYVLSTYFEKRNALKLPEATNENLKVRVKDASAFIKHNLNGTQLQKRLVILLCCKESFELVGLSKLNDKGMVVTNLTWDGDHVAIYADELQFLEII